MQRALKVRGSESSSQAFQSQERPKGRLQSNSAVECLVPAFSDLQIREALQGSCGILTSVSCSLLPLFQIGPRRRWAWEGITARQMKISQSFLTQIPDHFPSSSPAQPWSLVAPDMSAHLSHTVTPDCGRTQQPDTNTPSKETLNYLYGPEFASFW